jgi:large subunit ribosomal protein L24
MKIKKGDTVVVVAGADRGTEGKVIAVDLVRDRVTVEGVNKVTKHTKVNHQGPRGAKQGGIVTTEKSVHVSNVMLLDPDDKKRTRAGYRIEDGGEKVRVSRRTGKEF